jgi:hypothetical protein
MIGIQETVTKTRIIDKVKRIKINPTISLSLFNASKFLKKSKSNKLFSSRFIIRLACFFNITYQNK